MKRPLVLLSSSSFSSSSFFFFSVLLAFSLFPLSAVLRSAPLQRLYVSPAGQPSWSGRLPAPNAAGTDGPLPSLAAARDRIRGLRGRATNVDPVAVLLRGGTYALGETLTLGPEDSGVTYAAYPGERPVVSGGVEINGWKRSGNELWTAPAPTAIRQLFVDGTRAPRARLPVNGFYRIDGPSAQTDPWTLHYRGNDLHPGWAGRGIEVVALLAWAEVRMPIVSVDPSTQTARFGGKPRPSNREDDARYWIENVPEGLSAPGTWVFDAGAGTVTLHAGGSGPRPGEVVASRLATLVEIQGAHDVRFEGLEFRYADWQFPSPNGYAETQAAMTAPSALHVTEARGITVERCTFAHMGGYGVWWGRGSVGNRVSRTAMYDMGAGGIKVGETSLARDAAEEVSGNVVEDNDLHDLGVVFPSAIGIWVGQASGNRLAHNHIHHLFYTAISVGWTWGYGASQCARNVVEGNHLHDVGQGMLSDLGAIYTLGPQPGAVIRNNLIHDVGSFSYGGWGIYTDEGSTGIRIENNIVYRTKSAGFHQHYGRDNVIRNNVFALGSEYQLMRTRAEAHSSFTFEQNIVYWERGELLGSNWADGRFGMNRNVYWQGSGAMPRFAGRTWAEWQGSGKDGESVVADPRFRNAGSFDFRLEPDSPALRMGFQPIEMGDVGPRFPAGAGTRE